jgi:MFS family permease
VLKLWRDIGRDTRWVMGSYILWGIGEGLWIYIQPLYVKSLGATPAQTGLVLGMWGLGRLLFILPWGMLADRWGARRLMTPGWYLGLAGVLMIGLAPDWRWAAPGYLVYGISAAAIPATNLYITQAAKHDPSRHPDLPIQASLTLLWAAYSFGLVISPGIGGVIGDAAGLRSVFLFSAFWFFLSLLAILRTRYYPTTPRPERGYAYGRLLRQWPVIMPFGLLTLGFITLYVGQPLAPQYLEEARGFSRTSIGAFGSLTALGTTILSLTIGRLSSWRGFFASLVVVLLSFGLLLISGAWPLVAVACFMLGAYNTARALAVSVISERIPDHQRGMAYALLDTLAGLAILVGTGLAGILYSGNMRWPFVAGIAGIGAVMALGAILLRSSAQRNPDTAAAYTSAEQAGR